MRILQSTGLFIAWSGIAAGFGGWAGIMLKAVLGNDYLLHDVTERIFAAFGFCFFGGVFIAATIGAVSLLREIWGHAA